MHIINQSFIANILHIKHCTILKSNTLRYSSINAEEMIVSVNSYIWEPSDTLSPRSTVNNEHLIPEVDVYFHFNDIITYLDYELNK